MRATTSFLMALALLVAGAFPRDVAAQAAPSRAPFPWALPELPASASAAIQNSRAPTRDALPATPAPFAGTLTASRLPTPWALLASPTPYSGTASPPPTPESRGGWRTSRLLVPLAVGASLGLMEWDGEFREWAHSDIANGVQPIAHAFKPLGSRGVLLAGAGAFLIGKATGNETAADVGLHTSASLVVAGAAVTALKIGTGRLRPAAGAGAEEFDFGRGFDLQNESLSFPSGHTATAFALAASISEEAKRHWPEQEHWLTPALYAAAALVGLSRVLDDAHWTSDVLAGAVIGTAAGRGTVGLFHR